MRRSSVLCCSLVLSAGLGGCDADPASNECAGGRCDETAPTESCEGKVTDASAQVVFALSASTSTPILIDTTVTPVAVVPEDLGEWTLGELGLSDREVLVFEANLGRLLPRIESRLAGLIEGTDQRIGDIASQVQLAHGTAGAEAPSQPAASLCPNIGDGSAHIAMALSAIVQTPITIDSSADPAVLAPADLGQRTLRDVGVSPQGVEMFRSNVEILLPMVESSVITGDLDQRIGDIAQAAQLSLQKPPAG